LRLCKHFSPSAELNASIEGQLKELNVEMLPAEQTPHDFLKIIDQSDVVLLPYDIGEYRGIVSGVFCEASAKGKINVVADGTWMAGEIREGRAAGVTFASSKPDCVADAIGRAIDRRSELLAYAASLAESFRSGNSCLRNLNQMIALSSNPQEIRLAGVSEQRVTAGTGAGQYFGSGWSQIEPGVGIWSEGERAELIFNLQPSNDPLVFSAEVSAFVVASHPKLDVVFSIAKTVLATWSFDVANPADREWSRRAVPIPPELVTSGGIVLQIKTPASPLELGISTDSRKLGIAIRNFSLDRVTAEQLPDVDIHTLSAE
jgi:hypothetical protein